MSKIPGLNLSSPASITQTIDFEKELGIDISDNEELKLAIGQAIIDRIEERSLSGKNNSGKKLPAYSKGYIESRDFDLYGKSPSRRDMTLRGDMLEAIDILGTDGNGVVIGFDNGLDSEKAHGQMTGQNGKWKKKREFFGVNKRELKEIKEQFADMIEEEKDNQDTDTISDIDLLDFIQAGGSDDTIDAFISELFSDNL